MGKSVASRRRKAGRPEAGGADLRETLLDAAIACFVREGIAATPLRAIAREADVTPAMLHYYFGDKEALVQALVAQRFLPVLAGMRARVEPDADIATLIRGFVRGIVQAIGENPWLPSLWVREVLAEGGALRDMLVEVVGPQLPRMLAVRISEAQRKGELPADIDPELLVTSLIGMTMFPAAGAPVWGRLFQREMDIAALERHAIAMLNHGLGLDMEA